MKTTTRIMIWFLFIYIALVVATTSYTVGTVKAEVEAQLFTDYSETFIVLESLLDNFFDETQHNLQMLAENEIVTEEDDSHFTQFLDADPTTFKYAYTKNELKIIQLFKTYMDTHPHVNSVYMGRENGSFVRSHPRTSPTQYDPRQRPWYKKALEAPGQVLLTDPYASVTNTDVNIGSVLALLSYNTTNAPHVYGVLGIDVTLVGLSHIIDTLNLNYGGQLFIVSDQDFTLYATNATLCSLNYNAQIYPSSNQKQLLKEKSGIALYQEGQTYILTKSYNRLSSQFIVHVAKSAFSTPIAHLVTERIAMISLILLLALGTIFYIIERQVLYPIRNMRTIITQSQSARSPLKMSIKASAELLEFQGAYNNLVDQLVREDMELRQVKLLAINSLTSLAEKRDHETGLHILRTQRYVEILARAYVMRYLPAGVDEAIVERWISCAPLHDIGKVAIPDNILLKPGPLTPEEFEIMKKHTLFGRETIERGNMGIEDQAFIQTAINIVYYHHERWDGMGYPEGISGKSIPLEARIMSIADVYDALTSDRVYKSAMSHEEAISILLNGRGTQFQPELVDLFIELQMPIKSIGENLGSEHT